MINRNKKIKVLRIIARLNIGGPAIHVSLLTHGLNSGIFQSKLIAGKVSALEGDMSYILDALNEKPIIISELQRNLHIIRDLKSLYKVFKILVYESPDIVHTHTAKAGAIGRLAVFVYNLTHKKKIRIVHTFHGHVFRGYFGKLESLFLVVAERLLAKITDVIITISKSQEKELCEKYHIAPSYKFRTVELGFDLDPFFFTEPLRGQFRKSLGIDSSTTLIGIVGRLTPIKQHTMFLRSANEFLNHNPDISVKFLIIGDGELRTALMGYSEQLGITRYVEFCGWRRDLPRVYADLDIVALSSINEGTPVSLIEAMASSVSVISTDAGGVQDVLGSPIQDMSPRGFQLFERGILCKQGNEDGFAAGIRYLIHNRYIREQMIHSACSYVSQAYSKERLIKDIEDLYCELIKRRPYEKPLVELKYFAAVTKPRFKVLQVYKDYYPPVLGGMEKHINLLSHGLIDRGIQSEVLVSNTRPRLEIYYDNEVRIIKAPEYGRLQSAPITPSFYHYLRLLGKDVDILHFHFPNPTAELSMLMSRLSRPYVITYQSDILRQRILLKLYTPFMNLFLRRAEAIITSSPNYLSTSHALKRYKDKCVVIPLGILGDQHQHIDDFHEKKAGIRKKYGESIVLFIGRIRYYKGIQYLIRAMQKVDATLLIIGEGELVDSQMRGLVRSLSLVDRVKFLGTMDEKEKNILLYMSDLLVLPSIFRSEAFGLVLLEAMACGKPVISTELGTGTSFVNLHGETGLVVPPRDIDKLAAAINCLLRDRDLREKYGQAGKKRVQTYFTVDTMVDRVVCVYEEILNRGK